MSKDFNHSKLTYEALTCVNTAIHCINSTLTDEYFFIYLPINREIVKQYYKDYPNRFKARLYHQFIRFFFAIFPINGAVHIWMKNVFLKSFALTSEMNIINESNLK